MKNLYPTILEQVIFTGWTLETIEQAEQQLNLPAGTTLIYYPDGIRDLVRHFPQWADEQMLARWEQEETEAMKVREKITIAVRWRLEALSPYKDAVRSAMPHMGVDRSRQFFQTMDKIWKLAGDTSTDFNYYTKRALLSGVYGSTVLFWLQDYSDDHMETWQFLDRRIADALKLPAKLQSFVPPFLRPSAA